MLYKILLQLNKKKLGLFFICTIFFYITIFSFSFSFTTKNIIAEPNSSEYFNLAAGDYVLTVVSITGSVESATGGRVQINGSTVSGRESAVVASGTPTTVQAYVNTGYEFSGWYTAVLGGQLKTRNATFTFNMPNENTTYYAIFTVNLYTISAVSSPSGAGNITGAGSHNYNTYVTLNASPINNNYEFYRYIENSVELSTNPSYSFYVTGNKTLIAEFKIKVSVAFSGDGTVSVNNNSDFSSGYFSQTDNLVLVAQPSDGYEFIGWSNGSVSTSPTLNIVVGTSAKTYVANFSLIGANLFINATIGGNIIGSSENGTYPEGEIINLIATSGEGYHFLYWQGEYSNSLNVTNPSTSYIVMLSDVTRGNLTFTAVFERDYVLLNLSAVVNTTVTDIGGIVSIQNGTPSLSVNQLLPPEQTVTIHAIKKNGYKFLGWYNTVTVEQNYLISSQADFSFLMPITETTYYAIFQMSYWHEYRATPNGLGTQEQPYIINTANELAWLAYSTNTGLSFSNGIFAQLNNNLDLSTYMWEPIGNTITLNVSSKWQGNFKGGGYVISGTNIYKEYSQVAYAGLFGAIYGTSASITNLGVENINIVTKSNYNIYVGALCGQCENGLVEGCYVKNANLTANNIGGYHYIGGLVGNNINGTIRNCYVFGTIMGTNNQENTSYIGGAVGNHYGENAILQDVYSISSVQVDTINGQNTIYLGAMVGYNSLGATVKNAYYSLEHSVSNTIGVNNAIEYFSGGKGTLELAQFSTYVNEFSNWNFESFWFLPQVNYNSGYPLLRGVGNLIVNASCGENGTIMPLGQAIYFVSDVIPNYIITPNKNYEIASFVVDEVEQTEYSGIKYASAYILENDVGTAQLSVTFREQIKEPINPLILITIFTAPILTIGTILYKIISKKFGRKRRIKGAIKNYKRNKYWFIKYKK